MHVTEVHQRELFQSETVTRNQGDEGMFRQFNSKNYSKIGNSRFSSAKQYTGGF